jgi:hypothetical protein
VLRAAGFAFAGLVVLAALSNCSTALLNSNTLDLATTIDNLAVRQVIFNLAKIKNSKWALPSQIQISSGQVSARTNVAPSISSPLNAAVTGTTQVASQVVAATGALTTTTTGIQTSNTPNASASVSSTVEDTENWNVVPVQDPDQLRRLRLLYQYGARQIEAVDLLCLYPIPEIPEKSGTDSKSDLQILADALRAASTPPKADAPPAAGAAPPAAQEQGTADHQTADHNAPAAAGTTPKKTVYLRGRGVDTCYNVILKRAPKYTLLGPKPDPAFVQPPGCVICAYPDKKFNAYFRKGDKIYDSRTSDGTIDVDPAKNEYVPAIINRYLIPDGYQYGWIDWLAVVKDDEQSPLPGESHRVGSSNGNTIYTNNPQKFSEFVLAIQEATLQSPELQKTVAAPPPVVQTNPR